MSLVRLHSTNHYPFHIHILHWTWIVLLCVYSFSTTYSLFPLLLFFQILLRPNWWWKTYNSFSLLSFLRSNDKRKKFRFHFRPFSQRICANARIYKTYNSGSNQFLHLGEWRLPYRQRAVGPKFEKKKTQHKISMNALNFVCLIFSHTSRICFPLLFLFFSGGRTIKRAKCIFNWDVFTFFPLSPLRRMMKLFRRRCVLILISCNKNSNYCEKITVK